MAAPKIEFYADGGGALPVPFNLSGVTGTPGTALPIEVWNDKGGAAGSDDAKDWRVKAVFRDSGDPTFLSSGHEFADGHYLECRIVAGINVTAATTGWIPLGANSRLPLPVLASNQGLDLELRVNAPPSASGDDDVEVVLKAVGSNAEPTAPGLTLTAGAGIYLGLRHAGMHAHVLGGAVAQNPAGADDDVQVSTVVSIDSGTPYASHTQLVNLPATAAGLERYDLIAINTAGALSVTSGTEVTAPADDSDKPAIPADYLPLAWALVDATGITTDADLTDISDLGLYGFRSSGGIAEIGYGSLGLGSAIVDDALLTHQRPSFATLTTSSANWIWMLRDGTLATTTTATPPASSALLLHEATVDAVPDVTVQVDRRRFVGYVSHVVRFEWLGALATGVYRYATVPGYVDAIVLPLGGVVAALNVNATGGTPAGNTDFEVEYWTGASWQSIFHATLNRPVIANGAGDQVTNTDAVPALYVVPAGALLRAHVAAIPTGQVSGPSDAVVCLHLAL